MARSRNWESLSPTYRARLQRNGITQDAYLRGDKLGSARGHKPGHTPEHPQDAVKNPGKYRGYQPKKDIRLSRAERDKLEAATIRNADRELGHRIKYNPQTVRQNVPRMTYKQLIQAVNATANEWEDLGSPQYRLDEGVYGPRYHNPFFYH
jgi:hypothetical protein